jgi:hypothetical protein
MFEKDLTLNTVALSPSGRERGAEKPHLISSLRLAFYWRGARLYAGHTAAGQQFTEVASGALAGAT